MQASREKKKKRNENRDEEGAFSEREKFDRRESENESRSSTAARDFLSFKLDENERILGNPDVEKTAARNFQIISQCDFTPRPERMWKYFIAKLVDLCN